MKGRRLDAEHHLFQPGDYGRGADGTWYARPPWKGDAGWLKNHQVTEHEDGTITVSPSILISSYVESVGSLTWHGFLERGVWREC